MEIQRKTTNFLHLGSFFATLTILFFLCYSYVKTSHAPSSALGWLLLDHSDITETEENPFFFDSIFSMRLYVFCVFRCLFFSSTSRYVK